jgi:adenine deaminase
MGQNMSLSICGNIVDIHAKKIFYGEVNSIEDRIHQITELDKEQPGKPYILPGFIDSHVHIESSMLVPSEFAKLAVVHGTIGTVSDPHEIANVCGMDGVMYMIENGNTVPFKFNFGAPSCIPATIFETAGATINTQDVDTLLSMPSIKYLSEMMNFPGVLQEDLEVMQKIAIAKKYNKPIDGHAPALRGEAAKKYINAGITTDHECFTEAEALDKLNNGMKILIREGSAAKNFEALIDLMHEHAENMMFCSDDKHPDSLVLGHINQLCARAVKKGVDIFKVLKAACINPVLHYNLDIGIMRTGDYADFIVVKNLIDFEVVQTYINGQLVAENGNSFIHSPEAKIINQFDCSSKTLKDLEIEWKGEESINIIEALDGQLITNKIKRAPLVKNNLMESDIENDIIKIVVVNRYHNAPIAKGFIKNFGIKNGALASSVAHDSHNIVAVGANDEDLLSAINAVIKCGGGISAADSENIHVLPLPVGGLMSTKNGYEIAEAYTSIDLFTKSKLGSTLNSPFMTLSFMALLVIPYLKLSDKGLFDGEKFSLIN